MLPSTSCYHLPSFYWNKEDGCICCLLSQVGVSNCQVRLFELSGICWLSPPENEEISGHEGRSWPRRDVIQSMNRSCRIWLWVVNVVLRIFCQDLLILSDQRRRVFEFLSQERDWFYETIWFCRVQWWVFLGYSSCWLLFICYQ